MGKSHVKISIAKFAKLNSVRWDDEKFNLQVRQRCCRQFSALFEDETKTDHVVESASFFFASWL